LRQLGAEVGKSWTWAASVHVAFEFVGISGVIAIFLTATIYYLVVAWSDAKIPEWLANALTHILGFYFGSTVRKAAD
jgi:succinate dehydrogenase hydrophobic anchor subunit